MDGPDAAKFRALPAMQTLLETDAAMALVARHGRAAVLEALNGALNTARTAIRCNTQVRMDASALLRQAADGLAAAASLVGVINATGIVLHTNLGRAPLAQEAVQAVVEAAGACCLEYDLQSGGRGDRMQGVAPLLRSLTGAEAALVVNNCAAAMLLALSALAAGGEVIVSRGELVEIGGGFRIPDVVRQGGARLVEVGTTNRTRLADYREAITPQTRVLLKVHQANFRMVGFTELVPRQELAGLARESGLLAVEDLGSGALSGSLPQGERVQEAVSAGMDVVAFSGDKLLGGPQAGLLVGRDTVIECMRRHPLMRALRADKMCLAALEATLRLHRRGQTARIPALHMLEQDPAVLRDRAARLIGILGDLARAEDSLGEAGGGTLPGQPIPSVAVTVAAPGVAAEMLAERLRRGSPPVVGRVTRGRVWLDMLTVPDGDVERLGAAVKCACA